jgi:hypothetical protein
MAKPPGCRSTKSVTSYTCTTHAQHIQARRGIAATFKQQHTLLSTMSQQSLALLCLAHSSAVKTCHTQTELEQRANSRLDGAGLTRVTPSTRLWRSLTASRKSFSAVFFAGA